MTPLTEQTFRRLAQSSPWRFTRLHFTWHPTSSFAEPVAGSRPDAGFTLTIHGVG